MSAMVQIIVCVATYLEVLSDLTDKTLEGELADEQLCRLLVTTDLAKSDGSGPEAVRLLYTTSRGGLRAL